MIALLQQNIDWLQLIETAERHAVLPLLSHHLAGHSQLIPRSIENRLRQSYQLNALRNALLTRELCTLLELFASHHLSTIAFKGSALSLALYDNLLLRQFGDLDLFIRRSDLGKARTVLEANGYEIMLSPAEQRHYFQHRYHFGFVRKDGKVGVEMHWAFTPRYWPFPLDEGHLWKRVGTVTSDGTTIPCLSPEHTLLVLCAHGAKERWARLQLVTDVAELIGRYEIDWTWVLMESRRMGRERVLLLGLALAECLLDAAIPQAVREQIANDDAVRSLVEQLRQSFFNDHGWPLRGRRLLTFFRNVWPHRQDRLGYFRYRVRILPTQLHELMKPCEIDRNVMPLPRRLQFLHYATRPIRLAVSYSNPLRLLRRLRDFFF